MAVVVDVMVAAGTAVAAADADADTEGIVADVTVKRLLLLPRTKLILMLLFLRNKLLIETKSADAYASSAPHTATSMSPTAVAAAASES